MGNLKCGSNSKKGPNGLTPKMQQFCEEYVKDFNATQAYRRVSPECANPQVMGGKVLKKPEVKAEIERIQKALFEAQFVNYERIASELAQIAFYSKNEKNRLQALSLLQKQMGLEKLNVTADVKQTIDIVVGIEDDADKLEN